MNSKKAILFFLATLFTFIFVQLAFLKANWIQQKFYSLSSSDRPQAKITLPTSGTPSTPTSAVFEKVPKIDPNYIYQKIIEYEKIGPKTLKSESHAKAFQWILDEMKSNTDLVHNQEGETYDYLAEIQHSLVQKMPVKNVIAQINPQASKRILLSAHWDNRPYADREPILKNRALPVPGANDGGSGVAVLMAISKALKPYSLELMNANLGVDFAFWDAEDLGMPDYPITYCTGARYWSTNKIPKDYQALYAINFDMVGRRGSVFPVERYSEKAAPHIIQLIQSSAKKLGYSDYFPDYQVGPVLDDHAILIEEAKIPAIDLIYMTLDEKFAPEWHTLNDTSEFISRDVLEMISNTVIQAIGDTPTLQN